MVAFTLLDNIYILIALRGLKGISQVFLIIFSPNWLDEWAKESDKEKLVSYFTIAVPLG
jgi:hypothetical protein